MTKDDREVTFDELKKMYRFRPVTVQRLNELGYINFAWVCPSEVHSGLVFRRGGFAYLNKDDNQSCFMPVVRANVTNEDISRCQPKKVPQCNAQGFEIDETSLDDLGPQPIITPMCQLDSRRNLMIQNKCRFIEEVVDGTSVIKFGRKADIIDDLKNMGYDTKTKATDTLLNTSFDYLLELPIASLTCAVRQGFGSRVQEQI